MTPSPACAPPGPGPTCCSQAAGMPPCAPGGAARQTRTPSHRVQRRSGCTPAPAASGQARLMAGAACRLAEGRQPWAAQYAQPEAELAEHEAGVHALDCCPQGATAAVGTEQGAVALWDLRSCTLASQVALTFKFCTQALVPGQIAPRATCPHLHVGLESMPGQQAHASACGSRAHAGPASAQGCTHAC